MSISCGQCIGCRIKRAQDWAIRLTHEAKYHDEQIFLTLTFSNNSLAGRENPGTVYRADVQKFLKRLRNHLVRKTTHSGKFRYFAVGEYGEKTGRPHYHILLYGFRPDDAVRHGISPSGQTLFTSELLSTLWPYGYINFGSVTWDSASYCAGYITKKFNNDNCPERLVWKDPITGTLHKKQPEFAIMSLKPGIGQRWIEEHYEDALKDDYIVIKGKRRSLPRFYDNWLEQRFPLEMAEIKDKRALEFAQAPHITESRRVDMHLARWKHHTKRLRDETDGTDDIYDLRQQSESIPKAILHAQRRYSHEDVT